MMRMILVASVVFLVSLTGTFSTTLEDVQFNHTLNVRDILDITPEFPQSPTKVKAAFVLLIDNSDTTLSYAIYALGQLNNYFNTMYHYPLVVFYETGLPEKNIKQIERAHVGKVTFVLVDLSIVHNVKMEDIPASIPGFSARTTSIGYKSMCRFYSGDIFNNPALDEYDYVWRIDSDANYICPIDYDVFAYMQHNELIYGWTILMYEEPRISADTLWQATLEYIKMKGIMPTDLNSISTLFGGYDRCHYWNNFEVLDLNFFRSAAYMDYYNFLDKKGGFYLYRWGDALVRTVALHMLLPPEKIHFFDDIGYAHQRVCRNPCKRTILGGCKEQVEPYSGYCGIHSKICTVENHNLLVLVIVIIVVIAIPLFFFCIAKKRQVYRQNISMLLQNIRMKVSRFDPQAKDT